MTLPVLVPRDLFAVEHRLDGGPARNGHGFGPFEWNPAPNVPPPGDRLTFATVMHTTETAWVPSYGGGVHPHVTYLPRPHYRYVQHVRLDRRAGTLRGSSTVEAGRKVPTNRANVHQIEIAAYSSWTTAAKYGRLAVRDLDDRALEDLAKWIRWHHETFGSPLVWYPKPAGNRAHPMPHRLWTPLDGRRTFGVCDHATAPDDSTHWDSDDIPRARLMALAAGGTVPPPAPEEPMLYPRRGDKDPRVVELQAALNRVHGTGLTTDGIYGTATAAAVTRAQAGTPAAVETGNYAGPLTWAQLTTSAPPPRLEPFTARITPTQ